mmetsp:Transcript_68768/g.136277  ORF Transcript_68768/g.136277 Transcript_68768/m.136277 type:complete len:127 (-) Transcript_68768:307-687(-)
MSSDKEIIKQLKIKTGSVVRCMKDLAQTEKEIEAQKVRIQKVKDDPEKDDHDVKKQEEVLGEYTAARPDEKQRLDGFVQTLTEYIDEMEMEEKASENVKASDDWKKAMDVRDAGAALLEKMDAELA